MKLAVSRRGITLLELVVAMAIAGMIMAISFPSLTSGLDGIRLRTSAEQVAALLNLAKARVERDQVPVEVVIDPSLSKITALAVDGKWERSFTIQDAWIARVSPSAESGPTRFVLLPGVPGPRLRVVIETRRGRSLAASLDPITGVPQIEEPK
jgi:prepilin-type N-terminal cleavage/methylation domain-containing protein